MHVMDKIFLPNQCGMTFSKRRRKFSKATILAGDSGDWMALWGNSIDFFHLSELKKRKQINSADIFFEFLGQMEQFTSIGQCFNGVPNPRWRRIWAHLEKNSRVSRHSYPKKNPSVTQSYYNYAYNKVVSGLNLCGIQYCSRASLSATFGMPSVNLPTDEVG